MDIHGINFKKKLTKIMSKILNMQQMETEILDIRPIEVFQNHDSAKRLNVPNVSNSNQENQSKSSYGPGTSSSYADFNQEVPVPNSNSKVAVELRSIWNGQSLSQILLDISQAFLQRQFIKFVVRVRSSSNLIYSGQIIDENVMSVSLFITFIFRNCYL